MTAYQIVESNIWLTLVKYLSSL